MLEATIVSPRGSLYLSVDPTARDVQDLREHVRALCPGNAGGVSVRLRLGPDARGRVGALITALVAGLAREGIRVSVDDDRLPARAAPNRVATADRRRSVAR